MQNSLDQFLSNNKEVKKKEETDCIVLRNLWSDETFICKFDKTTDFKILESVELPSELCAFFHKDTNSLEFIYGPVPTSDRSVGRKFKFHFEGIEFDAFFDTSSEILKLFAINFREDDINDETNYRNLRVFRDYFREPKTEIKKILFGDKIPISFYVKGDFSKLNFEFTGLCKHLNLYMRFFDRKAPTILVFDSDKTKEQFALPCYTNTKNFPEIINIRKIDPVILDLFHVINETPNIRLKYIFYYQALEYCSYYHLNEELKRKLNNVVKNPDVLNNSSHYSRQIIEELF